MKRRRSELQLASDAAVAAASFASAAVDCELSIPRCAMLESAFNCAKEAFDRLKRLRREARRNPGAKPKRPYRVSATAAPVEAAQ